MAFDIGDGAPGDGVTEAPEFRIPTPVDRAAVGVIPAIDFHDEFPSRAQKVDDEVANDEASQRM